MAQQLLDRAAPDAARRRILGSSEKFWHPNDLRLPPSTAQHLLASLVEAGELRHVRRGLYWRGLKTPLGMSPPPQRALIAELAPGRGVGPAGLSAANALRLSTQIPRKAEYAVPHRSPGEVGSLKFVSRAARKGRARSQLNPTEVATLEVLEAWQNVIEIEPHDAMNRLADLVKTGAIRADRLAHAAATESPKTKRRLKALLEHAGNVTIATTIKPGKPSASPRSRPKLQAHKPRVVSLTAR